MRTRHVPQIAWVLAAACSDPAAAPTPFATVTFTRAPDTLVAPGTRFDTLVAALQAPRGEPIGGARVTWSGDGIIVPIDDVTRADGTARVQWTLPRFREPDPFSRNIGTGPSGTYRLNVAVVGGPGATATTAARSFAVAKVAASYSIGCGLRDAEVWCWGPSLADLIPAYPAAPRPQRVAVPGRPATVAVTDVSLCVVDQDGTTRCSAARTGKQFAVISGLPPITALAAFRSAWCAIAASDGAIWCWDLETGTTAAPIGGAGDFVTISGGNGFWCGRRSDRTAWCWGTNGQGQLGDGTRIARSTPTPVLGLGPTLSVVAGYPGACALTVAGEVWCWSRALDRSTDRPMRLDLGEPVTQVFLSDEYVIVRPLGNRLRQFWLGQEVPLEWIRNLSSLSVQDIVGREHVCVTATNGEVYCSVYLTYGGGDTRLGASELVPVPLPAP